MTGARMVIETLIREGVDTLFAYIGGAVIPIFDELFSMPERIRLVRPHHEQAGVHAADGYARATGKTGVVLVTSGPGATNTVTGIATAFMDSVPLVVITGQISSSLMGTDAFQEADTIGITLPITKASFLVRRVDELVPTLQRAFAIARSGRPGPVVVDLPSDIQRAQAEWPRLGKARPGRSGTPGRIEHHLVRKVWDKLQKSSRPLLLVGGGVMFSEAAELINALIDRFRLPVVHTLMGHGVSPADEALYLGVIGMHGNPWGNYALQHADLILALGTRFSDRILGDASSFAPLAEIIQVDVDAAEIGKNRPVAVPLVGRAADVIRALLAIGPAGPERRQWLEELASARGHPPVRRGASGKLKPQTLLAALRRQFPQDTIVTADVGQNQMWVAQYFRFRQPRLFLTSGGLGTMGYALPAAIGARFGRPDRPVLMIAGDGGFQMNIQELATVAKYGLDLKMVVLDNGYLGMVRQWQELLCRKRYCGTSMADNPDFATIARAYGLSALTLSQPDQADEAVAALRRCPGPMLLHARIDPEENVLPMVPPGQSLSHMINSIQEDT